MLDHRREQDVERQEDRARPPQQPAPALQFGTLGWASAVGNQAVARIARQPAVQVEEAEETEAETEQAVSAVGVAEAESPEGAMESEGAEAEAGESEAEMIPDDLPDELPE